MEFFRQMKAWKCMETDKREAVFAMLTKKTQVLSLQAYLINRCSCYQSISIEFLEQMFNLPTTVIRSSVNVLMTQNLVDAYWNEEATMILFVDALPARMEATVAQLAEKVMEFAEVNKNVVDELKGEKKEDQGKSKGKKPNQLFTQRNLRTRSHVIKS